jgi:hypothetical protein
MKTDRLKVFITCKQCGERFTLRGKKDDKGKLNTGFKKCLCDNENQFLIRSEEL